VSARPSSERGAALIEILVAMAILGISAAALLGGVVTVARTSSSHSQQAKAESVLTSAAEALRDPAVARVTCATAGEPSYLAAVQGTTMPGGWVGASAVTITSVLYWDGTGFGTPCRDTTTLGNLLRLQLVTIQVTSPDGRNVESVAVVKS
jgi:Tfp pilus assembly protein PilV